MIRKWRGAGNFENVELSNDDVSITLLPEFGGWITSIRDIGGGNELLSKFKEPASIRSREAYPHNDPVHTDFPGGYFEVLPNAGYQNTFAGVSWALHAETPYIPWEIQYDEERDPLSVLSIVQLRRYPLKLYRRISLEGKKIMFREKVLNLSGQALKFSWLHHPTFGSDLLDENTFLEMPRGRIIADDRLNMKYAQALPGAEGVWPDIPGREGMLNLSRYPPSGSINSNDLIYYPDISEARFRIFNERKRIGVEAEWDRSIFRSVWIWRPLGGGADDPWYGMFYGTAVELTTSWPVTGLSDQVKNGTAMQIEPHASLEAWINYSLIH